jgi:hypothetical protein
LEALRTETDKQAGGRLKLAGEVRKDVEVRFIGSSLSLMNLSFCVLGADTGNGKQAGRYAKECVYNLSAHYWRLMFPFAQYQSNIEKLHKSKVSQEALVAKVR